MTSETRAKHKRSPASETGLARKQERAVKVERAEKSGNFAKSKRHAKLTSAATEQNRVDVIV